MCNSNSVLKLEQNITGNYDNNEFFSTSPWWEHIYIYIYTDMFNVTINRMRNESVALQGSTCTVSKTRVSKHAKLGSHPRWNWMNKEPSKQPRDSRKWSVCMGYIARKTRYNALGSLPLRKKNSFTFLSYHQTQGAFPRLKTFIVLIL